MKTVVMGFPVHEALRAQLGRLHGVPLPPPYSGSVQQPCSSCGVVVWVGPRSQAVLRDQPDAVLHCAFCVIRDHHQDGPPAIRNLGNPEFD